MSKLCMNNDTSKSSKKPAPNSIGSSHQVLKNRIGTLKGLLGTIGDEKQGKPKGGTIC